MDNLYLKFPTLEDKEEWLEYIKEYLLDNPKARPLGYSDEISYEKWLDKITKERDGIDLESGRVPSSMYFLIDNEKIVGTVSIRHNLDNDFLALYGGHIGYGVRPSERRKGYATIMLHLTLEKCKELGLSDVMVSCKEDNIGSAKTIENNFGVQTELIYIEEANTKFKKYWINVNESLENFANKKTSIKK